MHTDINIKSRIEKFPAWVRPYAYLARLDRPIGVWLLLLPGWWAIVLAAGGGYAMNAGDARVMALFGIGAVVMRAAGCVINDLWDLNLDKGVERTAVRPLAAGTVTPLRALFFLALLLFAGFVILLQMPPVTVLLGVMAVPLVAVYPLMKRITWWPQAFLGLTFNFSALMGWSAVTGVVALPALFLYIAGVFWTLGYDTIYAHQDREDDLRMGIKSSALKLGVRSKKAIAGFYTIFWLFIAMAFTSAGAGLISLLLLLLPAFHLFWQLKTWNSADPVSSLHIFKSSRNCGILIFLAAGL